MTKVAERLEVTEENSLARQYARDSLAHHAQQSVNEIPNVLLVWSKKCQTKVICQAPICLNGTLGHFFENSLQKLTQKK